MRHAPIYCDGCGGTRHQNALRWVTVEPIPSSRDHIGRLRLCDPCVYGEGRTWRRRWRTV